MCLQVGPSGFKAKVVAVKTKSQWSILGHVAREPSERRGLGAGFGSSRLACVQSVAWRCQGAGLTSVPAGHLACAVDAVNGALGAAEQQQ